MSLEFPEQPQDQSFDTDYNTGDYDQGGPLDVETLASADITADAPDEYGSAGDQDPGFIMVADGEAPPEGYIRADTAVPTVTGQTVEVAMSELMADGQRGLHEAVDEMFERQGPLSETAANYAANVANKLQGMMGLTDEGRELIERSLVDAAGLTYTLMRVQGELNEFQKRAGGKQQ